MSGEDKGKSYVGLRPHTTLFQGVPAGGGYLPAPTTVLRRT